MYARRHSKRTFVAQNEREEGFTHVLLITTGSVASVKAPLIVKQLLQVSVLSGLSNTSYLLPNSSATA